MLPSLLLTLREGLEGSLVIGLLLGTIKKMNRPDLKSLVWTGVISAIVVSLLTGIALTLFSATLEGEAEEIFEGITMMLAAIMLTSVVFWIYSQSNSINEQIKADMQHAVLVGSKKTIFLVAFLSVVREGVELALILVAASFTESKFLVLTGSLVGLVVAVLIAYLLFNSLIKLNLQKFFLVTSILLVLFAAGLIAHGVHEFNEVGWIPGIIEHVWDLNPILPESSYLGQMLTTLFGYNGNPSLTEVAAYLLYFVAVYAGLKVQGKRTALAASS